MSKKLEDIREEIDSLDNQIHDLLMQRASLIIDVCEAKRKSGRPVVQPAREAMMIRRLLRRHEGVLPQAAVVGIWRELVGAVCLLQKGLHVRVASGEGLEFCWDAAKDYFGSVLPMSRLSSASQVISIVREDDSNIGVLPWPSEGQDNPWWLSLLQQDSHPEGVEKMRIVCALPYGATQDLGHLAQKSLVVGRINFSPSGQDHSFIAVEINRNVSRARLCELFLTQELEVVGITPAPASEQDDMMHYLLEVSDYVAEGDEKLQRIQALCEESQARLVALGGYPVPPVFREGDTAPLSLEEGSD